MKGDTSMNEQAQQQMEQVTKGLMQACEDMGSMTRDSVNAVIQSTTAATKGYEEFNRNLGSLVQESLTRALSAGKTIAASKSLREMMETQAEFARDCFDSWVAGASRLSEISARATQEAFEPVTSQANAAFSKISKQVQPQSRTERAA